MAPYVVGIPRAVVAPRGGEAWLRDRIDAANGREGAVRGPAHRRDRQASGRARLSPRGRARRRRAAASLARAGIVGDLIPVSVDVDVRGSGGVKIAEVVEAAIGAPTSRTAPCASRSESGSLTGASSRRWSSPRSASRGRRGRSHPTKTRRPNALWPSRAPSGWTARAEQAERAAHLGVLARPDVAAVRWPRPCPGAVLRVGEQRAIAHVRPAPRRRRVRQAPPRDRLASAVPNGNRMARHQADALHRRAVGKRVEQRREAEHAGVRVVVEVLLRAALAERRAPRRRAAAVGAERAGDHLGGARGVAVDERRDRPSPAVDAGRLGRAIRLERPVAPLHRKERRARDEEAERVDGAVGRAAAVAAQVEDDAR